MEQKLLIYNTLTRTKERFTPLHAPNVGMYVCGPTVYGDPHLGHARPAITFDILFRYLKHLGYKVRYVRNITDVGHLEHDADEGDDKIEKKARLEQLEPMEIAQYYTNRYHQAMEALNVLPPSIEPHATGHIIEQEKLVQEILDNGYAYESNGSIYFDIEKYNKDLASSRWKNIHQIDTAGHIAVGDCPDVEWWEQNWRKGGLQMRRNELLHLNDFYNQLYCGCEFSLASSTAMRAKTEEGKLGE